MRRNELTTLISLILVMALCRNVDMKSRAV
nr:MAG TPA: hypothetical protein [Caudoviricetes sp.]